MSLTIHSKQNCKYCILSKEFLNEKNIPYTIIEYDPLMNHYEEMKTTLMAKTNHKTFPQIFVGETFIGGYSELVSMYDTCTLHDLCKTIGIIVEYDF